MSSRSRTIVLAVIAALALATLSARLLGYNLGFHTYVRCRKGHLFTTIWIPGVKLKGFDFGIARFQYCPVGKHWSLVRPVKQATLNAGELRFARGHHDIPIP